MLPPWKKTTSLQTRDCLKKEKDLQHLDVYVKYVHKNKVLHWRPMCTGHMF